MDFEQKKNKRAQRLLALGALIGIGAAIISIVAVPNDRGDLPTGVVARVNSAEITQAELDRAWNAIDTDKRGLLTRQDKELALTRLIDEELLTQRGVEIGMVDTDRRVRQAIVGAMVDFTVADAKAAEPDGAVLRAFYQDHLGLFSTPERLHLRLMFFRASDDISAARERVREALQKLNEGADFLDTAHTLGDLPVAAIPDAPTSLNILRRTLGPALVEAALSLEIGKFSEPLEQQTGFYLIQVLDADIANPKPFEEVRASVVAEYRRRARDVALDEQLSFLRSRADIVIAPGVLAP